MNLVVTGATSFLGTAFIRQLLTQGHQVYGVVRPQFIGDDRGSKGQSRGFLPGAGRGFHGRGM